MILRPTTLVLVRHGLSVWNLEGKIQGHADIPLHATGIKQAERTAKQLASHRFDAMYSSDLPRAVQTAEIINEVFSLPIVFDERLRERNGGKLQGLSHQEAKQRFPNWELPEVGRESALDFRNRAVTVFTDIAARQQGSNVLIVSHGGLIYQMMLHLRDIGVFDVKEEPENSSITWLNLNDNWEVVRYNDHQHILDI